MESKLRHTWKLISSAHTPHKLRDIPQLLSGSCHHQFSYGKLDEKIQSTLADQYIWNSYCLIAKKKTNITCLFLGAISAWKRAIRHFKLPTPSLMENLSNAPMLVHSTWYGEPSALYGSLLFLCSSPVCTFRCHVEQTQHLSCESNHTSIPGVSAGSVIITS